jgi:type I restriction enzyme S subunit
MSEWKETTLGDVLQPKGYIRGPFGSSLKRGEMKEKGIPVYEQKNAIYNEREFRFFIDDEKFQELKRFQVKTNDLIISCSGTVGKISIIKEQDPKGIISQALLILRPDVTKIHLKHLFYLLSSKQGFELITQASHGSVQINIAERKVVENIPISLPPLPEQTAIASVLSSLDDKIDLLHRQNATLEKMAETLFRQWFVEEVKEDWESMPLSKMADFLNGLACQKFRPKNEIDKLPVLKIKELSSGITDNSDWASTDIKPEFIVRNGDIIFAWSASLMVKIWDGQDCILNQHLFKVTSEDYPKWFYYLWCKHHLAEFISIAASHATTMGHIKRGDLDEAKVLIPSPDELAAMTAQSEPLIDKIITNNIQINTLTKLRDLILPKLMSGEVRVDL